MASRTWKMCENISRGCTTPSATSIFGPKLYTHYYKMEFPERFHSTMDTRRWGPGERIVFEKYSKEVFEQSFERIAQHEIFAAGSMGSGAYDQSAITLAG